MFDGLRHTAAAVNLLDWSSAVQLRPAELRRAGDIIERMRATEHFTDDKIRIVLKALFCTDQMSRHEATRHMELAFDVWDEDQDGDAEQCMLGPPEAGFDCCMIGPEPLAELCDRLDVPSATAPLSRLFAQVMGESDGGCVTVEMMRKKIRAKLEKRPSPNAVIFPEAEGA